MGELHQPSFSSLDDIDTVVSRIRLDIQVKETLINRAVTEHTKIKDTVDVLVKTGAEGTKALLEKRDALQSSKETILARRKLALSNCDPTNCLSALDSINELLVSIFSAISENADKRYSSARLQEVQSKVLSVKDDRARRVHRLSKLNADKVHMEAHKVNAKVECPICHHQWVQSYSDVKYAELEELITRQEDDIQKIDKQLVDLEVDVAQIQEYAEFYRDYIRCTRNWPALNPLWDHLTETGYVTKAPRKVLTEIDIFRHDMGRQLDAAEVQQQINELNQLIRSSEQVGDANLAETRLKLDEITFNIEEFTADLTRLQSALQEYQHYRKQIAEATDLSRKITTLMRSLENINTEMIEMLRRETLNHCIRQLQHQLARKEETLSAMALQRGIILDLENQIEELTVQDEAAKALVKQLSPTDGLIAEGLLGFIRGFTMQMNALIRKIWAYPLHVKDCGVSGEVGAELDYKFPMMVQTKDNIVPDVSKGSSGMQEIVNLAFKVVAMKFLGLSESPLYLDEFGATFDVAHRNAAMHTIKALMEQQSFSQLFMVSHYESTYGSMTNAEICVLCSTNITVPGGAKYNQHVSIT